MYQLEVKRSEKIVDFFTLNSDLIKQISKKDIEDLMEMCSYLLGNRNIDEQLKSKVLTVLYHIACTDDISLEESWQIYWIIKHQLFVSENSTLLKVNLDDLYGHIFEFLQEYLKIDYPYLKISERNNDVIVIITSQFLGLNHAPTRRVLDYSYAIQKELGKKVIIINDAGTNFYRSEHFPNALYLNYIDQYSHMNMLPYKDENFEFLQVGSQMPNVNIIAQLLKIIYKINPLLVFNIGASSLIADLCSNFTTTASLPCSHYIPISRSKYLVVARKVDGKDRERINRIATGQIIVETVLNYKFAQHSEIYDRKQFGLSEDSFVIVVVGNRLDDELSMDFLNLLNEINDIEDIHILFIGGVNDIDRIKGGMKNKDKIHFTGHLSGASEAIKLCNLYLNPKRKGGGRSAFEALHYGIPVITMDVGDVYYVSGSDFSVNNYNEMYDLVKRYYTDAKFYQEMKIKGINRANELGNIAETQKKMIEEIMRREAKK